MATAFKQIEDEAIEAARSIAYSMPIEDIDMTDSARFVDNTHWAFFERLRKEVQRLKNQHKESNVNESIWMDEARQQAAQCWCDKETESRVMDTPLAEAVAKRIAAWMDTAAQSQRNTDFYRGIVTQIGEKFGTALVCVREVPTGGSHPLAHECDDLAVKLIAIAKFQIGGQVGKALPVVIEQVIEERCPAGHMCRK